MWPVIALIGGRAGAFGGAGLTTATCSRVAVSEQGRIAVSGPEVIETNKGVEEFDAENKALVWSTDGGKNCRLIGGADTFGRGFQWPVSAPPPRRSWRRFPAFDLKTMQAEQERLASAAESGSARAMTPCPCGGPGASRSPQAIRDMDSKEFARAREQHQGSQP